MSPLKRDLAAAEEEGPPFEERRSGQDRRQLTRLPRFEPFTYKLRLYRDVRDLSHDQGVSVGRHQNQAIASSPLELHCDTFARPAESRVGRGARFDQSPAETLGDTGSINFGAFDQAGRCVDAFGLMSIRIKVRGAAGFRVVCRAFPSLIPEIKERRHADYAVAVADLFAFIVDHVFDLQNGQKFDVLRLETVNFWLPEHHPERVDADIRVQLCDEEMTRRSLLNDHIITSEVYDPTRGADAIRRGHVTKQRDADYEEPVERRVGPRRAGEVS